MLLKLHLIYWEIYRMKIHLSITIKVPRGHTLKNSFVAGNIHYNFYVSNTCYNFILQRCIIYLDMTATKNEKILF